MLVMRLGGTEAFITPSDQRAVGLASVEQVLHFSGRGIRGSAVVLVKQCGYTAQVLSGSDINISILSNSCIGGA